MANHKSAIKRVRANETKRLRNKYVHKTTRNAIREIRSTNDSAEFDKNLPDLISMIDKLAKNNVIHKNKASNLKSKLMKKSNTLKNVVEKPVEKSTKTVKAKATTKKEASTTKKSNAKAVKK